ncbi:MAG: hypothetical protein NZ518_08325, partial [Dehalococcoidia bacterium]|nr:hypothetical protein [Dehalococcoidia bacterium]
MALGALPPPVAVANVDDGADRETIRAAVESGRLDPEVAHEALSGRPVAPIVVLDDGPLRGLISRQRAAAKDSPTVLAAVAASMTGLKASVAATGAPIVRDYEYLPLQHAQTRSVAQLAALARQPLVAGIRLA